jgi:alcohol dehydrogenase (NADP+)
MKDPRLASNGTKSSLRDAVLGAFSVFFIGGIKETQEMLDFCGKHNITADIEPIQIQNINDAYDRLVKSDVKYRFVIDMASLQQAL